MDPRLLDPSTRRAITVRKVFGELWHWKEQRIRNSSPFGRLEGWRLAMFIVKAGDDLRQEQVAMQLITLVREIFKEEGLELWLRPYDIVCVGDQAGLIEAVADAKSIDHIKKRAPHFTSLKEYYERIYGGLYSRTFREAQRNFMRSLAGYCVCTYLLQVKDRHNANILIDKQGHLIHIDFGFMLGASPGSISFESAPFKLTKEYVELLGGQEDMNWQEFRSMVVRGFGVLNQPRHRRRLLDLMAVSIFEVPGKAAILDSFDKRLIYASYAPNALALVDESFDNYRTKMYDSYQKRRNGIW
jgi:phosphatidylinositol 4-kinase